MTTSLSYSGRLNVFNRGWLINEPSAGINMFFKGTNVAISALRGIT